MDPFQLDTRLAAVEAAVYKQDHVPSPATQNEVKELRQMIQEIEAKLRLAESRSVKAPALANFATKQDVTAMARVITKVVGEGGAKAEAVLQDKIDQRIKSTLATLAADVAQAKGIAFTTASEAADILRARAAYLSN
jgi:hypothetical protein